MTEKRFQVYKVIGSFHEWSIEDSFDDKVVFGSIMHKYNADRLCAKLNELAEEKEICKQAYREIKEDAIRKTEENKELEQFKKSVFALINEKITFVNECEKNHNDIGIPHEYYRGADEILNLLKKELV